MFGIGMSEMVIILAVALLVFGPEKLPEVAKTIAKGLRDLRRAGDDLRSSVDFNLDDDRPKPRRAFHPPEDPARPRPSLTAGITGSDLAVAEAPSAHAENDSQKPDLVPAAADGILAQGSLIESTDPAAPSKTSATMAPSPDDARISPREIPRAETLPSEKSQA